MVDYEGYKFGFGCMRLPVGEGGPADFDYPKIEALFDEFLARGFTYFDTAYTYHGYHAEEAVGKVLVARHPRNSFQLATKLPLRDFKDAEDMERIFAEQLEHCDVDYFDYYLLHNMGHNVYAKCVEHDAFGFVARKKTEGKIRNVGMSFHDMPELLEEILGVHGEVLDFVQLQINYADWDQPNVQSRRCLEIANAHNLPVVVMEPCKGATLVNVPQAARDAFEAAAPGSTPASWALRFAGSQPGVFMVLSGMNELEQVQENCDTFANFQPLTEAELDVVWQARAAIEAESAIACTACEYCTHDCPQNIPIPQYFALYNSVMRTTGSFSSQTVYYNNIVQSGRGKASECIKCGLCEAACPQHLPIRGHLESVADKFEDPSFFPTRK
ncbi:MAG: aldo/keto reductase [Eggerthellaceae bacterium]|nr:aldo/keto reductase [Eggerthellaceae bacterium]